MQRVELTNYSSGWLTFKGSMPQENWLGPSVFILLSDDLSSGCTMHTFVDDVTLSEVINKHDNSYMYADFNNVVEWSDQNLMNINVAKTKKC